jgi:hypothetical protein
MYDHQERCYQQSPSARYYQQSAGYQQPPRCYRSPHYHQ